MIRYVEINDKKVWYDLDRHLPENVFDSSLSMGEIKKRITENDYVVQYDLTHWDITEDMEGIDRIASFENLVSMLQNVGAAVSVYNADELLMPELFHNKMVTLREIRDEVKKDMDRESTE